jgi:hypothetical protein
MRTMHDSMDIFWTPVEKNSLVVSFMLKCACAFDIAPMITEAECIRRLEVKEYDRILLDASMLQ